MPYRTTRSWREWFFEVFAPNSYIPFEPLPMTEAERRERDSRREIPEDITRLDLEDRNPPRR